MFHVKPMGQCLWYGNLILFTDIHADSEIIIEVLQSGWRTRIKSTASRRTEQSLRNHRAHPVVKPVKANQTKEIQED